MNNQPPSSQCNYSIARVGKGSETSRVMKINTAYNKRHLCKDDDIVRYMFS